MYGKALVAVPSAPMTRNIFVHLTTTGKITNIVAQNLYKCRALPRRIKDIKEQTGLRVMCKWKVDATGQRYKVYYLEGARV